MVASDMLPAVYADGRYLRRWSLIGGHPRCILPPLVLAEAAPAEVAAVEAANARIHGLAAAAEALEAQAALAAQPTPDLPGPEADAWQAARQAVEVAAPELLALVELRQAEFAGPAEPLALIDPGGAVVDIVAVDSGWLPDPPLIAVPLAADARVGGTYADGVFAPPARVAPMAAYEAAIAAHVEATARARTYSSAASCAGYATSTVAAWAAEAAAFVAWRDAVYLAAFDRLAEVQGGAPAPTVEDLLASLPQIAWPT